MSCTPLRFPTTQDPSVRTMSRFADIYVPRNMADVAQESQTHTFLPDTHHCVIRGFMTKNMTKNKKLVMVFTIYNHTSHQDDSDNSRRSISNTDT